MNIAPCSGAVAAGWETLEKTESILVINSCEKACAAVVRFECGTLKMYVRKNYGN